MEKSVYISPIGTLLLMSHNGNLVYCNWISNDCNAKQLRIENYLKDKKGRTEDVSIIDKTIRQLDEYFTGKRKVFDIPLGFLGSEFRCNVWHEISKIKYGKTVSYKFLAEKCGNPKAFQAIAQACGANPVAIIVPCHRITSSNGSLGGYTGGIDKKIRLLSLEKSSTLINSDH